MSPDPFALDDRLEHRYATATEDVGQHAAELQISVFEYFLDPQTVLTHFPHQLLARTGQVPQLWRAFLVLHFYLDDGGTMNGDYICLAGYAATDGAWKDLSSEWQSLAKERRLPDAYLHTADFFAAKSQSYTALDLCPEQRVAILREFVFLINKYLDYGVVIGVDAKELKEITKDWPKEARVDKHEFCLLRAVRHLQDFRPPSGDTLGIICDHTDSASHMLGAYRTLKKRHAEFKDVLAFIAFGDDRLMQPLQAADLLACTTVNEWIRIRVSQKGNPMLPPLEELLVVPEGSRITYTAELWDKENIEKQAVFAT